MVATIVLVAACSEGSNQAGDPAGGGDAAVTVTRADSSAYPIVYSQLSDGQLDLYLTTPDGGEPAQLTGGPANEVMPAWSPDGSQIAFVVSEDLDTGPNRIYVLDTEDNELRSLTPTDQCASNPSWSPDGGTILYLAGECGGEAFASVMSSEGAHPRSITDVPVLWPDWSSQGRIVYQAQVPGSSDSALFVADDTGADPRPVDTGDLPSGYEATWSPEGDRIAYVAPTGDPENEDASKWNEDIFVVDAEGTGARRVVGTLGNDHWPPAWSPDGRQLLYTADGPGNTSTLGTLMLVDLDTGHLEPLAATPCQCLFPDWRR
jgi:TolB protein